ncbi:MAG: cupredoxin domain-containing protein [Nanoarchaeota archaeon]|nr:cupredoxin domain-containing protein [Nanoarchaeota archaeon]
MKNKNLFFIILTFALIVFAGFFLIKGEKATTNNVSGDVQIVKLWTEGANYVLNPSEFKKDIPVRIEADVSRTPGCSRSIVIPAFNVRKVVGVGDNVIEFTPTKKGTFNIACSMNMYQGTFKVV